MRKVNFQLQYVESTPSTSALLIEQLYAEDFHGKVICAHQQTKGVGRRGRNWDCGSDNLAFSIGFALGAATKFPVNYIPIWAAIALYDTVEALLQSTAQEKLTIKWPNDLCWEGKKFCGLLSQVRQKGDNSFLVLGIGLNVANAPKDLPAVALNNMPLLEKNLRKESVLETFLVSFQERLNQDFSFSDLKKEWELRAKFLGQEILYGQLEGEMLPAKAISLAESCELIVELLDGKEIKLSTEDVSLRML